MPGINDQKKYYWLKLRKDFIESAAIDFILSQQNGSDYFCIYTLLCMNTINKNGILAEEINEMIIPYTLEKIQRDLKYFKIDTIRMALGIFEKLGLATQDDKGIFKINNFNEIVGSETGAAIRMRISRARNNLPANDGEQQENK